MSIAKQQRKTTSGKRKVPKSRDPDYVSVEENRKMLERLRNWRPKQHRVE